MSLLEQIASGAIGLQQVEHLSMLRFAAEAVECRHILSQPWVAHLSESSCFKTKECNMHCSGRIITAVVAGRSFETEQRCSFE